MSETFQIKPATRQGVIPWIDLYSESGCGKTYSSLLLARGIVGPKGKIAMLDSESGRGSLYADVIPGGYDVANIEPPFSPARYIEALTALFKSGAAVVVVDSMSHEWEGIGGVIDMAGKDAEEKGKSLNNWNKPKLEHAKLVQFLLRSPVPIICCVRAKYKTRQKGGQVIKDDYASPIQAEDFIFEATAHAQIMPNHSIYLSKCSHPELRKCFPENDKGPLNIAHGEAIARWCKAPGGPGTSKPATDPEIKRLKKELWDFTEQHHHGDAAKFRQYLVDEILISPEADIATFSAVELQTVLGNARDKKPA